MPYDFQILYVLMALVILVSLLAMIGAWRTPKSLTREEAEDLFASAGERNAAEAQRVQEGLRETQKRLDDRLQAFTAEMQTLLRQMDEVLQRSTADLQNTVCRSAEEQGETLRRDLGTVTAALSEAQRNQDEGIRRVEGSLQQIRQDVDRTAGEMRNSIIELARQHNEAKAQSAIQLCEALINSLGTLRNTIAAQIADQRPAEMIDHNAGGEVSPPDADGPEHAPDGPDDVDKVPPEDRVSPS